jgi:L-amino acid N-acyltransferase YncA
MRQLVSQRKNERRARENAVVCERELLEQVGLPNPFAPTIDIYLRPATVRDAEQVGRIYNHYVTNSYVTEDQEPVVVKEIASMIQASQREKLPFIVAILGKVPVLHDVQGRVETPQKAVPPAQGEVVGFATAEIFNFGWGGARNGRSRYTANLQLYVSPYYVRRGIGRNLLDRLMFTLKSTYSFMDTCAWVNLDGDKTYEHGGAGKWHQLLFQLPILKEDDTSLPWIEAFLKRQFFFNLEYTQKSLGRTTAGKGIPVFTDTAVFQVDSLQAEEYFD